MDKQTIRRRCAARVRELTLPTPFDIETFCAMLGQQRGRPIHVYPLPMRWVSSAIWLMTDTADDILFEQCSTAYHQLHIIFHELGHILCGHQPGLQALQTLLRLSPTELSINLPRLLRLMCRAAYSSEGELEAELFASLLRERVSAASLTTSAPTAPELARLLHHLAVSLAVGEVLGCVWPSRRPGCASWPGWRSHTSSPDWCGMLLTRRCGRTGSPICCSRLRSRCPWPPCSR